MLKGFDGGGVVACQIIRISNHTSGIRELPVRAPLWTAVPAIATSTTFFFRLKRSKVFQQQPVHEDVPAAHLAQEDAPGCVVEEADVV